MKKILLSLLMAMTAITSSAQTIGEAFYIYRNDGDFNAFFREEVDSIVYSNYDADSIWYDDVVSQVIYTPDSTYFIPLATIDSVGFVTPETVYAEDVKVLSDNLFDYVIAVDGLNVTLSSNTPASILPKQGDIIATVELSDKFPCGFSGKVNDVSTQSDGIILKCDSVAFEEAVDRFYGMVELVNQDDAEVQSRRYATEKAKQFTLDLKDINMPVSLSGVITQKDIFDIKGAANLHFNVKPHVWGKLAYVIDKNVLVSYVNIHTTLTLDFDIDLEVAGVANKEFKKNLLPKSDFMLPWGIPFYAEIGPKLELNGEFAVGTKVNTSMTFVQDIIYRPLMTILPVVGLFSNKITQDAQRGPINFSWQYLAGRGTVKGGVYVRLGIPFGTHDVGWVGGEFDGPFKTNIEFFFDINRLKQADKSTALYDELKDLCKLDINPYVGAKFVASVKDDKFRFEIGKDFEKAGKWFSGRILPAFSNLKANRLKGQQGNAEVTSNISKSCPIPFTVGFTLLDNDKNKVEEYYGQKYSMLNNFTSYKVTMKNLSGNKEYECHPMIKLFGYNMLASPSCDLDASLEPTTLDATNIKNKGAQLGGSISEYNPSVDKGECGFFYNTSGSPTVSNGTQVYVGKLSNFSDGKFYKELTDLKENTTYYYCAYYYADGEYVYGESKTFKTQGDTTCPDGNHPHAIDLGLPSGTKWACCNVGASSPEDYGGYYAWGETSEKSDYTWENYQFYDSSTGGFKNIGSDIAGTSYDVAHVKWGGSWRMPSLEQIRELLNNCTSKWTSVNGTYGREFTGPNGGKVFLPAVGNRWGDGLYNEGGYGYYWSSTQHPDGTLCAYYLYVTSGGAYWSSNLIDFYYYHRSDGHGVRSVSK